MGAFFVVGGLGRRLGKVMQITIAAAGACAFVGSISQTYSSPFLTHIRKQRSCDMSHYPNAAAQTRSLQRVGRVFLFHHGGNPPRSFNPSHQPCAHRWGSSRSRRSAQYMGGNKILN